LPQARSTFVVVGPSDSKLGDLKPVEGTLSEQVKRLVDLTVRELRTNVSFDKGGERVDELEIPIEVLREVISNAITHRDYQATGTVQVRVKKECIEVINPGKFPSGCSWTDFLESEAVSVPADETIAYYLTHQLAFEGIGRGFSVFRRFVQINGDEVMGCRSGPGPTVIVRIKRPQPAGNVEADVEREPLPLVAPSPLPPNPRMIGRNDRLEELVMAILEEDRPIVVPGGLGMGKTTLALAATHDSRVIARFGRERRFFVNLEPAPNADGALTRLATELGLPASGAASEVEAKIAAACAAPADAGDPRQSGNALGQGDSRD
jgi:hypothetical protein